MAIETLTYIYTSWDEIKRLWSAVGQSKRTDDLGADLAAYQEEVIAAATDKVNEYCLEYYLPQDMQDNRWVRTRATWIACYYLSRRRANAAQFRQFYADAIKDLEAIHSQLRKIPRLNYRAIFAPTASNLVVDDSYQRAKLRVERITSTEGAVDGADFLDWPPAIEVEP